MFQYPIYYYFHSLSLSLSLSLLYSVPQIVEEPDSLENVAPRNPAELVVKVDRRYLTCPWHRQDTRDFFTNDKRGDTQILRIDKVESIDEGYYVCTISNPTGGSVETTPVQLTTSMCFVTNVLHTNRNVRYLNHVE